MLQKFHILLVSLFCALQVHAQCPGETLADSTFSDWKFYIGLTSLTSDISGIDANIQVSSTSPRFQYITDQSATDPYTNNQLSKVAPGMSYSMRIGDGSDGSLAERMITSFVVDSNNRLLTFRYAVVSERPDHPIEWQPIFGARLRDQNDSIVSCVDLVFIPNFSSVPTTNYDYPLPNGYFQRIKYTSWQTVSYDLTPYLGQTMSFEVANGDCVLGSHFSYAYFSLECQPFQLDYTYCINEGIVNIQAPSGFKKYSWNNNSTGISTTYFNPSEGDSLICEVESDASCLSRFAEVLVGSDVLADFSVVLDTALVAADFTNLSAAYQSQLDSVFWDFGDGNSSTQLNPVHFYDTFGIFDVTLYAFNNNGCKDSITKQFINYPPAYPKFKIADTCGLVVDFINQTEPPKVGSITNFFWDFGDGNTSTDSVPTHEYKEPGTYQVRLEVTANDFKELAFDSVITIYPYPVAQFKSTPACVNNPTLFEDISTISQGEIIKRTWDFGAQTRDSIKELVLFDQPGFQEVSLWVVSDANCTDRATKEIEVYPKTLKANFYLKEEKKEVLYPFTNAIDSSVNAIKWNWFVDGELYASSQDVYLNFDQEVADYKVLLQVENEYACVDSISKIFRVEPTFAVYVPNAFTPDGDGINDEFIVRGEGVQNIDIQIHDRWGNFLARHQQLNTPIQIPLESANHTFYYELFITDKDGVYHYREGIVNVIK